jgi:hypothetical protein
LNDDEQFARLAEPLRFALLSLILVSNTMLV